MSGDIGWTVKVLEMEEDPRWWDNNRTHGLVLFRMLTLPLTTVRFSSRNQAAAVVPFNGRPACLRALSLKPLALTPWTFMPLKNKQNHRHLPQSPTRLQCMHVCRAASSQTSPSPSNRFTTRYWSQTSACFKPVRALWMSNQNLCSKERGWAERSVLFILMAPAPPAPPPLPWGGQLGIFVWPLNGRVNLPIAYLAGLSISAAPSESKIMLASLQKILRSDAHIH